MSDARMIRDIEEKLQALDLPAEEEAKRRKALYKALGLEQSGYSSKDLELPEGSILIGVVQGELKQALATEGLLWVDGEGFAALSAAAAKATGRPTMYGRDFWTHCYIPRSGIIETANLWLVEARKNGKRTKKETE